MIKRFSLLSLSLVLAACGQEKAVDTPAAEVGTQAEQSVPAEEAKPAAKDPATIAVSDTPEKLYARCAACHGTDGSGVPGAFPALKGNIADLAASPEGRAYLIAAVRYGVSGSLTIDEATYNGMMPAQYPALNEADIASALNHIVSTYSGGSAAEFTTEEVVEALAKAGSLSNAAVLATRPE